MLMIIMIVAALAGYAEAQPPGPADPLELPRRQDRLTIDGDLSDWKGPALRVALSDTSVPAPQQNSGEFLLVWDHHHLWFGVTITDNEVYPAPEDITGSNLYQWDSVELYIDGHGNRSDRMDENDTQFIIACDGRYGAMQGDELLRSVERWKVPKREQLGLAVRTAAKRTPTGYVVEGAFPLAAVKLAGAQAGQTIALDLAWNDWIEDHPRLPEVLKDLENLALFSELKTVQGVAVDDPDNLGWEGLHAWEVRAYRPHSWRSGNDFGRPPKWRLATFVGKPPLAEALIERWGLSRLLGATFLVLLAGALAVDLRLRRRYRQNLRKLMNRVEALTEPADPAPTESTPPESAPADPRDWVTRVTERLAGVAADDNPAGDAIGRLLVHIHENLDQPLSVTDVAAGTGVSPRTLQRICRDEFGAPPRDVILAVKMRTAREALASGRWQVREVAEQVGFDSPYHFSRRFKDFYGEPPSEIIPSRPTS